MNKFLILIIVATTLMAAGISPAFAQQAPPLEKPEAVAAEQQPTSSSLGKITIQISQTEQIIIDLPLKSENKYQVIPIK
jgi:lipoprotein NlpI